VDEGGIVLDLVVGGEGGEGDGEAEGVAAQEDAGHGEDEGEGEGEVVDVYEGRYELEEGDVAAGTGAGWT